MNKAKLNFAIDALMFLCMAAIAGLGFLMKYVLLPGRESTIKYERRVELTLLGLDRHDWGTIHLYLGFLLLALLVLHIVLHWQMIPGLFGRLIAKSRRRWKDRPDLCGLSRSSHSFSVLHQSRGQGQARGQGRRYSAQIGSRLGGSGGEQSAHTLWVTPGGRR